MAHFSTSLTGSAGSSCAVCKRSVTSSQHLLQKRRSGLKGSLPPVGLIPNSITGSRRHASTISRRVITMAAKVTGTISLALEAGKANPAPPVGPALGAQGVNIMQFCKQYNSATADKAGQIIPVEITVFSDRSFTFILKTPPASFLLRKAAGVEKGSGNPNDKVGEITQAQLKEVAEIKLPDLNCSTLEAAMETVKGTAKNMGITVAEE